MQSSTPFREMLAAAGVSIDALKTLRHRHQAVFAFGRTDAYKSLGWVPLDAVAAVLATHLTNACGKRDFAAGVVRDYCDQWAKAVAAHETERVPSYFVILEFRLPPDGALAHLAFPSPTADMQEIAKAVRQWPQSKGLPIFRMTVADIGDVVKQVRENARKAGHDGARPGSFRPMKARNSRSCSPSIEKSATRGLPPQAAARRPSAARMRSQNGRQDHAREVRTPRGNGLTDVSSLHPRVARWRIGFPGRQRS